MNKTVFCLLIAFFSTSLFAQSVQQDSIKNISQFEFAYPFWSPDGKEITFQSNFTGNWQLFKMDSETKEIIRLTENKFNDMTPSWSPDGEKILFTSDRDGDEEIYVLNIKNNEVKQLTNNGHRDIHPNWSPDGRTIVFNSDRNENKPQKLFITAMDENGGNVKIIKEDEHNNSYASFSPDGKKIAFLKWMGKGSNGEIFYMNLDGTNEVRLTENKVWDGWPTWSAKGDKVIYSSDVNDHFQLFSVDISSKKITQLTFGGTDDARANCRRDGESIVFNRGGGGKIDIIVMRVMDEQM